MNWNEDEHESEIDDEIIRLRKWLGESYGPEEIYREARDIVRQRFESICNENAR